MSRAVTFNGRGSQRFAFQPYAAATPAYARPGAALPATELRLDPLGREVLRVNPPDGLGAVTDVGTAWFPLGRTRTDEEGRARTFLLDGLGRVSETRAYHGAETYSTRNDYDPLGRVVRTTDALGEHPHLRLRRPRAAHPDRGPRPRPDGVGLRRRGQPRAPGGQQGAGRPLHVRRRKPPPRRVPPRRLRARPRRRVPLRRAVADYPGGGEPRRPPRVGDGPLGRAVLLLRSARQPRRGAAPHPRPRHEPGLPPDLGARRARPRRGRDLPRRRPRDLLRFNAGGLLEAIPGIVERHRLPPLRGGSAGSSTPTASRRCTGTIRAAA